MLPLLSVRCHEPEGRRLYDALVDRSFAHESDRADARDEAFQAAVLTSRRRVWALVRRSGAEGEWFVMGLAAQKNYLSLYVNAADGEMSLGQRYAGRLGKVKAARANVQFKSASDLDLDVVREMAARARELAPTT